tara:strand:+ start:1208 stop:1582 length:375 start_codon:yes stop_codon:yes gene_type:complete
MINIIDLLARISISLLFLINGYFKIVNYDGTMEWIESFGLPGSLIIPAIILEIIAPMLLIVGYKTKLAAAALGLFCLATAIIFHNDFGNTTQLTAFLKNIALMGGFLFLFMNGAKDFSLDKKLN